MFCSRRYTYPYLKHRVFCFSLTPQPTTVETPVKLQSKVSENIFGRGWVWFEELCKARICIILYIQYKAKFITLLLVAFWKKMLKDIHQKWMVSVTRWTHKPKTTGSTVELQYKALFFVTFNDGYNPLVFRCPKTFAQSCCKLGRNASPKTMFTKKDMTTRALTCPKHITKHVRFCTIYLAVETFLKN